MKLREALQIAHAPAAGSPYHVHLIAGFEPLHLKTFLAAALRQRLRAQTGDRPVRVETGLFGDWGGNLERALSAAGASPVVAILEWADLHAALGWREASFEVDEREILQEAGQRLRLWSALLRQEGGRRLLALPALPLPVWTRRGLDGQYAGLALGLEGLVREFAVEAAGAGVRVAAPPEEGSAWDAAKDLTSGFPYRLEFASALAERLAGLALPATPCKGLVTDLDQTLWKGVVGDDGPEAVAWDMAQQARPHGWWQQFLASLARQGVLIGVATKNDPEPVAQALGRPDLLMPASGLFPVEAHWRGKAESLRRIAQTWNIGLDAMVFVDDNELELEAVRQELPELPCYLFPAGNPEAVVALMERLRPLFGKEQVSEEDHLRLDSLRAQAQRREEEATGGAELTEDRYQALAAQLVFDIRRPPAPRALELLNKTNQFNLNGRRWEESEWKAWAARPESLVVTVRYQDRFGPLGAIAVVAAERESEALRVRSWVMSCRAFSRRIEFATLRFLAGQAAGQPLRLDWAATPRNGPTATLVRHFLEAVPDGDAILELLPAVLAERTPPLYCTEVLEAE